MKLSLKQRLYGGMLAAVVAVTSVAYVHAQNAGQILLSILSTDLIQVYRSGTAAITYASPSQITSQSAYYTGAVPTGFAFYFNNTQTSAMFQPASTIAVGYVYTPPAPSDGDPICAFSTAAITAFYFLATGTQTVNNAVTTLAANAHVCYTYQLSNTTWSRSQ